MYKVNILEVAIVGIVPTEAGELFVFQVDY